MPVYQKPISKSYTVSNKTLVFDSSPNQTIYNPFDGMVKELSDTKCGGYIKILHSLSDRKLESSFCNVGSIARTLSKNQKISSGKPIGETSNEKLKLTISENGSNVDPVNYIDSEITNKSKSKSSTSSKTKDNKREYSSDIHLGPLTRLLAKGIETPFNMLRDMPILPGKFKNESKDLNITEEIDRIKKLMK
jgi:hypothetical protein